ESGAARSAARVLWNLSQEFGRWRSITPWLAVLGAAALFAAIPRNVATGFPAKKFPVDAVARNAGFFAAAQMPRILTSDQWADYLIYRLYPRQRVFFDGRSDFYGPALGGEYRELQTAGAGWREALRRHGFERALLPRDW